MVEKSTICAFRIPFSAESERRPRSPATHRGRLENFVGEEAPEARVGPRNPDAFYRGEEAGAALTLQRTKTINVLTSKLQAYS